jgi:alanyl-tRNA synthetase
MNASQIRKQFLDFFRSKNHLIVPSAPIVVKDDPTLMFTNAGMNQFKDYFLGNKTPENPRIADTQKCLRVSGKHNDLEEVGVDTYHHTMFEMLGNWSFGDYFKKEAIEWAWELLTEVYKIDKDRLYVTVFEGSPEENIPFDQEAYDTWKKFVPESRILNGNKKDNFWEMGDTGPCGPCTEIHYDSRSIEDRAKIDGATLVNNDDPLVIEIWNNVFIEFERKADGSLVKLPAQHVDTGMGFERLVRVLQGKKSNYDTDIFMPLIQKLEQISGKKYGDNEKTDIALRVISDHIRAISFTIADGQLPASNGAGYVIRRILRRAVRYGYTYLGFTEPFLTHLYPILKEQFAEVFPEITAQEKFVCKVIQEEESGFFRTLATGLKLIDEIEDSMKKAGETTLKGEKAFELYDTFGFPLDLTQLIAQEKGLKVDVEGFNKAMQQQKERSRNAEESSQSDWVVLQQSELTEFVGYDQLETEVSITKYRRVEKKGKTEYHLVFDKTPFYAESGGQVGDSGILTYRDESIFILNTTKENQLFIHVASELPAQPEVVFSAKVNSAKRHLTAKNHTATHLLHEALREVLGTHVEQRGSLVNSEYLRFDFSHFQKMTDEEIQQVENKVNEKIWQNLSLCEMRHTPIEKAKAMGAMALFGEKYGDSVRVIQFGSSVELCGGTHVKQTGEIGLFKIAAESSIAAGIRRVEAVTERKAIEWYKKSEAELNEIGTLLKATGSAFDSVVKLTHENTQLKKDAEQFAALQEQQEKQRLLSLIEKKGHINTIIQLTTLSSSENIKNIAFQLKNEVENLFLVLGADIDGKALLTVAVGENLSKEKNLHAGNIVRELAKEVQGGGGGQPFYATAGGKNPDGLPNALSKAADWV